MAEAHDQTPTRATRDLALAAFASLRGFEIVRARRRKHEFEFLFRDPDGKWDGLRVEFTNSEFRRYDGEMLALKKLANGTQRGERSGGPP